MSRSLFPSKASIGCCYLFLHSKPVLNVKIFFPSKAIIGCYYLLLHSKPVLNVKISFSIQSQYWMLLPFSSFKASIECQDPFHSSKASIRCCDLFSRLKPVLDVEFSLHSKPVLDVVFLFRSASFLDDSDVASDLVSSHI